MPERNLVRVCFMDRSFMILVVALTIISMQLGCSKLRQSNLTRDLLGGRNNEPSWSSDSTDSASRYVSDPYAGLDSVKRKDEARIVGIRAETENSGESDVKLVASQPAPSLGAKKSISSDSVDSLLCEHDAQCDCHKPKMKPRLPYAEPVELPQYTSNSPPIGIVHQPLRPILFDAKTREIQAKVTQEADNSLRQAEKWLDEKVATLEQKQTEVASAVIDATSVKPNPVRFAAAEKRISHPIRALDLVRAEDEMDASPVRTTNVIKPATPACPSCQRINCDGSCVNRTVRVGMANLSPIVDSDPVIIVATTSATTIPPFAEPPVGNAETDFTPDASSSNRQAQRDLPVRSLEADTMPELEIVMPAPVISSDADTESVEAVAGTETFDDLSNEEWLALFGPMNGAPADCAECESGQCQSTGCGQTTSVALVETNNESKTDEAPKPKTSQLIEVENAIVVEMPAPSFGDSSDEFAPAETEIAQASSIKSTSDLESSNDFQPASHTTETGNLAIENSTWPQPETTNPVTGEPSEANSDSNFSPTIEAKNVEAREMDVAPVMVLDPVKMDQPKTESNLYRGPQVRFEVIDNTVPWDVQLSETIQNVKSQLATEQVATARNGLEVNLRLLEMLQRQMADVEVRQDSLSNEEKQYWQHQLDAITLMLHSSDSEDSDLGRHRTAINTLGHLRKAVERLESIADLRVSNGAFCTEVSGFGQFKTFPTTTFSSEQPLLVYCEIENYSSMQRQVSLETEVLTRLRGSYVIYDQQGRAVQQAEYPVVEDIARKRRRDFYMHFPIQLDSLPSGNYHLELMVEDLNGNKTGSINSGLEFQVK